MFKVVCISDMDDCISLKNRLTRLYFVLLNKPCFLDVQCRPSLIWESLSNLRRALFCFFLYKNVSSEALKAHKGEPNISVVEC